MDKKELTLRKTMLFPENCTNCIHQPVCRMLEEVKNNNVTVCYQPQSLSYNASFFPIPEVIGAICQQYKPK